MAHADLVTGIDNQYRKKVTREIAIRFVILYLLLLGVVIWICWDTWIIYGWLKLCSSTTLRLSDFNSIFELSTAFYFAYHVIVAFRTDLKDRIYGSVDQRLQLSVNKLSIAFFKAQSRKVKINIYKSDLEEKWAAEKDERKNSNRHRIESSFFHFAFFCLVAIICGAFLGADGTGRLRNRLYCFLLVFCLSSIAITEYRYRFNKHPHFERTVIYFVMLIIISWPVGDLILRIATHNFPEAFFLSGKGALLKQPFANCIVLLVVLTHFWPFFLFFRKMYFFALTYNAISYLIAAEVKLENSLEKPFGRIGDFIFNVGSSGKKLFTHVEEVGKGMKQMSSGAKKTQDTGQETPSPSDPDDSKSI